MNRLARETLLNPAAQLRILICNETDIKTHSSCWSSFPSKTTYFTGLCGFEFYIVNFIQNLI